MFSNSEFTEVAPDCWRAVAEPETVNIGLIAGKTGALLIDTGSSPEQGEALRAAAARAVGVPLAGVLITHDHYDHIGGLAAFSDLPRYGHESVPGISEPLALAKVVDLGGRRVELVHFGPAHTQGDVVAIVPDTETIFAGDLLESAGPPQFGPESDFKGWPHALDGILGVLRESTLIVPGHGEPFGRDFAFDQRARIAGIFGNVQYLLQRRIPAEHALNEVEWPFPEESIKTVLPLAYEQIQRTGRMPQR
jgi:glyoxylase-like metal-dependent hydrolase (beta-lactamase superfamily II)